MKRFIWVSVLAVTLGLVMTVLQAALGWELGAFLRGYWIAVVTLAAAMAVLNLCYRLGYHGRLRQAAALLEEGKADEYITTVEGLLQTAKGEQLKNQLRLNLTAGYYYKKDFLSAIRLLEELEDAQLLPPLRLLQRLNLCLCYFYTNQDKRAMAVYQASDELFAPYRGGDAYGKNIAVADMLADIQKGDHAAARELLATARETWNEPGIRLDFDYIETLLEGKQ